VDGPRAGRFAGFRVVAGVLGWGLIAALGLGAVLAVSTTAYAVLQISGALYLLWLGAQMLVRALRPAAPAALVPTPPFRTAAGDRQQFARGLMTNLLNPKVGIFYVSFLPQFIPPEQSVVVFSLLLAAIHAALGLIWFALLTGATTRLAHLLARPAVKRGLDGTTGALLIGFGLSLALERRA
jgi:threonine/homoserine/homoserine lactone efflux protein